MNQLLLVDAEGRYATITHDDGGTVGIIGMEAVEVTPEKFAEADALIQGDDSVNARFDPATHELSIVDPTKEDTVSNTSVVESQ